MNKIEKQILENQLTIMASMRSEGFLNKEYLNERVNQTRELLNPINKDEECSDGLPKECVNSGRDEK